LFFVNYVVYFLYSTFKKTLSIRRDDFIMQIKNRVFEKIALICPKCRNRNLRPVREYDAVLEYCAHCHGFWVDIDQQRTALGLDGRVFTLDELKRLRRFYKPFGKMKTSGYPPCPICQQLMNRKNWGSYSGVIVDFCLDHGTWFEADQLEKVREYVALGGAEYEKWHRLDHRLSNIAFTLKLSNI